jgi:NCS1 nucleoside transporter family
VAQSLEFAPDADQKKGNRERKVATTTESEAEIEQHVPVREGEYGTKVAAVEPGGVEYIPERERHGNPIQLFWTWMSPNMEFATVFVGVLPIALFGGAFWPTVLGLIIGNVMGGVTQGILSQMGPRYGVPQMVEGRAAFGYFGNFIPAFVSWVTASFGWFVVNSVSGAFALVTLSQVVNHNQPFIPFWLAFVVVVLAQVVVAFIGHNLIHSFERVIFPYLAIVFGIATIIVLAQSHPGIGFNAKAPVAFGGPSGAFILSVFLAFGYAIGWNPFASDYSRYLPRTSNPRSVALAAGLGIFISCTVLEIAGAAAATIASLGNNPTALFTNPLPTVLQVLVLLGIALGAVAANVLNMYSGAMGFLTLGIKLPLEKRRAIAALVFGAIGLVIGFVINANVGSQDKYTNFLLMITYWITPWFTVVITDFFLHRGQYREEIFYDRNWTNGWRGAIAMVLGFAATIPFWDQSPPFLGVVPTNYPQFGDLSFFAGFIVALVVYLVLYQVGKRPAGASVQASA